MVLSFRYNASSIIGVFLAIAAVITCFAIYNPSDLAPNIVYNFTLALAFGLSLCVFIFTFGKHKSKFNLYFFLIPLGYFIVNTFNYNEKVGVQLGLGIVIPLICVSLCTENQFYQAYKIITKILVIECCLSFIALVDFLFGLNVLPHRMVPFYMEESHAFYADYYITYIYVNSDFIRLCGFTNEPGFWGTITALVLVGRRCNLRNKENLILFIGGSFTFSVAFFTIFAIGIIWNILSKNKGRGIVGLILIGLCLIPLSQTHFQNPELNKLVERFQYDKKTGKFKGDNRSNPVVDHELETITQTKEIFFGKGTGYVKYRFPYGVAGAKRMMVDWGLLGFFVAYFPLLMISIYVAGRNRLAYSLILCFFLSVYQRQDVFTLGYLVILLGGIKNLNELHSVTDKKLSQTNENPLYIKSEH